MMIFVEKNERRRSRATHHPFSFSTEENFTRNKRTNDEGDEQKRSSGGHLFFSLNDDDLSFQVYRRRRKHPKTLLERSSRTRKSEDDFDEMGV